MVAVALLLRRNLPLLVAFALAACGRSDRGASSSTQAGAPSTGGYAGPQALVLRVPRAGGAPRVHAYPRVDSVVWTSSEVAPTPSQVLAFDDDNGSVAYQDIRGRPVLLELRGGSVTVPTTRKLDGLASANGRAIFGIGGNEVVRMTPTGEWSFKAPARPRSVYPQPDGSALVAIGSGANTRLLKMFPPDTRILDSIPFPVASRAVRSQLGDRLYLAVDTGLVVLRTRTMDWGPSVAFTEPIVVMASTPSGDRIFVLTEPRRKISVVDRYRDRVAAEFELPGAASDMRVDPFGRYLLARAAGSDSIWVIAIGTERVIGGVRGAWRADLPFVGYDGAVTVASGEDVVLYDGETLRERSRVRGGAQDYWYPFMWDGFRPRAAGLDVPVQFDSVRIDTTATDTTAVHDSTGIVSDTSTPKGYIVSFAAFPAEDRAKELASRISVDGENARVVAVARDGLTIYRVVLGPYLTREEAETAGRNSGRSYWVYEGVP
jgi:hypothetical protein